MAFTTLTFASLEVLSSTKMTQLYENTKFNYDKFHATSGHKHAGTGTDAPILPITSLSQPYMARVYMAGDQTAGGGYEKLNFDSETFDIGSNYDTTNKRFVCPVVGYYRISGCFLTYTTGGARVYIYVNGGAGAYVHRVNNVSEVPYDSATIIEIYHCTTPGNYIEIFGGPGGPFKGTALCSWVLYEFLGT